MRKTIPILRKSLDRNYSAALVHIFLEHFSTTFMNIPWQVQLTQSMSSAVVRDGCRLLVNLEIIDGKIRLVLT